MKSSIPSLDTVGELMTQDTSLSPDLEGIVIGGLFLFMCS